MGATRPTWTLTLPSDVRLLPVLRAFVEAVCQTTNIPPEVTDAIVLCTHEAATNAIRHAHGHDVQTNVQLQCIRHPEEIEIQILDEGAPFDLTALPALDPAELRLGGRGVFLMRKLMDEVSCVPRGARGNALRLVKRLTNDSAPRDDT